MRGGGGVGILFGEEGCLLPLLRPPPPRKGGNEGFVANMSLHLNLTKRERQMSRELSYTRAENPRPCSTVGTTQVPTLMGVATCQTTPAVGVAPHTLHCHKRGASPYESQVVKNNTITGERNLELVYVR